MRANPHPIACFARLQAARARRRSELERPTRCYGCYGACAHVPEEVWNALECAYPDFPLDGRGRRQVLADRFVPHMVADGWRFCRCYARGHSAEHRFISRLVDTCAANAAADALDELRFNGFFKEDAFSGEAQR